MAAESALLVGIGTAMASGLVKAVLEKSVDALSKTSSFAGLKSAILGNLKPQLIDLERELSKLHTLLCAAESLNPVQNRNDLVLFWLGSVREAANFADNVLEEISYDQIRRQAESNMVAKLFSGSDGSSLAFRIKIGRKLSKFMIKSVKIYKEAAEIGLRPAELLANPSSYQAPAAMSTNLRETRESVSTLSVVVGRQLEEDWIVRELSRPTNAGVLGVIALVGMSGVGKTTLARKIYDNESVREHYTKKTWIFVSDDFNLRRLLDEMLQSLTGDNHNLSNIGAMEHKLQGCLDKERYLLVLDDVWNTDQQIWDSIKSSLVRITNGCTGSMVLVTTQSYKVASVMGASLTHPVKVLINDDAWALFAALAFQGKSQQQVSDLRDIGEKILRKCGGLPLAINILGSLLGSMDERSEWESVEKSEVWNLSEGQTKIMPCLLLPFNHLPSASVKQCFAHFSVGILRGDITNEGELINNWIAQGFIQPSKANDKGMVAMGREHIRSMLANGLLQSNIGSNGKSFISMHDLIHDLALYVSRDTCLIVRDPKDLHKASSSVEHLLIHGGITWNSQVNFLEGCTPSNLRTLSCLNTTISIDLVAQARFLRQLCLKGCGLKDIPQSIGKLKHLRILELDYNPFEYLPESIGKLYNLQVLSLRFCYMLVELPQQLTKLFKLRVLHTTKAVHIPKGMGHLTCLTQLPEIKLKAGDGCKIKELSSLLHLTGQVVIKQLENISCKEDATEAGLKMKAGITRLVLIWTSKGHEGDGICSNDEEVMEGLQPHSNLEFLQVENFGGKRFSLWLSNGLSCNKLKNLNLYNCKRCEQLPTLGCLPSLKYLSLDGIESVEVIGSDFFYTCDQRLAASSSTRSRSKLFPQLKGIELFNMPKLKDWFDPLGSCASSTFPCLEELYIIKCPFLVSVPSCFYSLMKLTINNVNSGQPLLMILSNSCNLTSLTIEDVHQLTCLSEPLLNCTSLRLLRIIHCKELVELPPTLQNLHCLETLDIRFCGSLTLLPSIKGLLSLSSLVIFGCKNITETPSGLESCVSIERLGLGICPQLSFIPDLASLSRLSFLCLTILSKQMSVPRWLNHLPSLSELIIGGGFSDELDNFSVINQFPKCLRVLNLQGSPELKSLPNELRTLTQLEQLHLSGFEGVIALPEWMGNLSSLQVLSIWYCKNIKQLPSVDVMQSLTQLRELNIKDCPLLEERCNKEGGEEWHKISHLSFIQINGIRVI